MRDNMEILQLSNRDFGGAGKAAFRLNLGLNLIDVKSKMLVLTNRTADQNVIKLDLPHLNIPRKIRDKIRKKIINTELDNYINVLSNEYALFSNARSPYRIDCQLIEKADILNLHWIARMIDACEFVSTFAGKRIVWTLHDMNPFTGGCHYSRGCTRYRTGCGACPQLGSKNLNDLSKKIFKRKERAYKNYKFQIVTPSKWLHDCARESLLFRDLPIEIIPNGIQTDAFKKRDKKFLRNLLKLPLDKTLILFGLDNEQERKGVTCLLEALTLLKTTVDTGSLGIVLFGNFFTLNALFQKTGFDIYQFYYTYHESLLSALYSSCDIFVLPSVEDNFPNTLLESMSCQTPAVCFNAGGMKDIVMPYKTGCLAELKNVKDLADKIGYMITHPKERFEMGKAAGALIEKECSLHVQATRYQEVYKKVLNE